MTYASKEQYNSYMNEYMKSRWARRRLEAINYLGGACVQCGNSTNLEFDHVDPTTKTYTVASASSRGDEVFWKEVDKCQLLCYACHKQKTSSEQNFDHGGGVAGKKNCKCALCTKQRALYMKNYKARKH